MYFLCLFRIVHNSFTTYRAFLREMMKKTRLFLLIGLWIMVAAIAMAIMLFSPKDVQKIDPQTWQASVEWMPSQMPVHTFTQGAIYPAMDKAYLTYRDKKNIETAVYGPPYIPPASTPIQKGAKPVLVIPEPVHVEESTNPYKEVRIAIIIDDMGMGNSTRAVAELPAEITLSFLPYAPNLQDQVRQVLARGHEVMLHIPMEPQGYENPGPGALLTTLSSEELSMRLSKALDSFEGYIGVNNHMGSKFTKYRAGMEFVAEVLREKGLFFIDSLTSGGSLAGTIARQAGVRTTTRDIFLDHEITTAAIQTQLKRLEQVAHKKGTALAICHPHKLTLSLLTKWLQETDKKHIRIVPASELVK